MKMIVSACACAYSSLQNVQKSRRRGSNGSSMHIQKRVQQNTFVLTNFCCAYFYLHRFKSCG